ncbi:hypothetical protein C8R42DRAFT_659740 [Lentinula raphanica]|nr:hypothetical protein C8R42DRAFT_659740 [Lentinula raphanica]
MPSTEFYCSLGCPRALGTTIYTLCTMYQRWSLLPIGHQRSNGGMMDPPSWPLQLTHGHKNL